MAADRSASLERPRPHAEDFTSQEDYIIALAVWAADCQLASRWHALLSEVELLHGRLTLVELRGHRK